MNSTDPTLSLDDFRQRLEAFAADAGLRWNAVASIIGTSPSAVARWLAGSSTPSDASIRIVSNRLDRLYSVNSSTGLFRDLHELNQKEKVAALRGALYQPTP